jgi:hypothetical protein
MGAVGSASLSSSLPVKERRALTDSATASVEKLANMVQSYPEYKVVLITLFNGLADFGYDAEDWEKAEKAAKTAQNFAQPLVNKSPEDPALQRLLYRSTWLLADALSEGNWPAPGSADTELGVLMEPEVCHGETEVYTGVQA